MQQGSSVHDEDLHHSMATFQAFTHNEFSFSALLNDNDSYFQSQDEPIPDVAQYYASASMIPSSPAPFSLSIPPPTTTTAPQQHLAPSTKQPPAKRKRAPKEELLKPNTLIIWSDYVSPGAPVMSVHERLSPQSLDVSFQVGHIDKNALLEGDRWCIFRQNQFKLQCTLQGALARYTTPVLNFTPTTAPSMPLVGCTPENVIYEIDGLYMKVYAFRQSGDQKGEDFKVPIHTVGPSRTKKENKPPEIAPIRAGSVFFDRLQFQASTHVVSNSCFRIVVCLLARVKDQYHIVGCKISPKLIVRAQNPGRYHLMPSTPQTNSTDETPTAPSTPAQSVSPSSHTTQQQLSPPTPQLSPQKPHTPPQITITPTAQITPPQQCLSPPQQLTPPQSLTPTTSFTQLTPPQQFIIPSPTEPTLQPPTYNSQPLTPPQPFGSFLQQPIARAVILDPHSPYQQDSPSQQVTLSPSPQLTPPQDLNDQTWMKNREMLYYYGRVGINTNSPQESLTVNGNIMVTGDVLKPSDQRLKDNFVPVNNAMQFNVINNIKIYDYDLVNGPTPRRERGVIAQELAKALPAAVHHVGEYKMANGQIIDNLLVVNERVLLLENIGATQYLNKVVTEDRAEIDYVNNKVEELENEERQNSSHVMSAIHSMASYVMSEDFKEGGDDWIYCGLSLFGLGPAWSMFLLGFICPISWLIAVLYCTAPNPVKRTGGIASLLMLILTAFLLIGYALFDHFPYFKECALLVLVVGIVFLFVIAYYRVKRQRLRNRILKTELQQKLKTKLVGEVVEPGNNGKRRSASVRQGTASNVIEV